tara:strand:+ start:1792 stop:3051 length:1260 start_codon:yes stop_codon:yes gene_type:complete
MTFNWPDIPFSGTEVDAFVVEYKALAQAIIDEYEIDNDKVIIMDKIESYLEEPYRDINFLKELLENGLLYASFIIKQRSGGTGPGTDFIIGNSPFLNSMSSEQRLAFFEMLGCVFTKDAMAAAFNSNTNRLNGVIRPELAGRLIDEVMNGATGDPYSNFPKTYNNQPPTTVLEDLWNLIIGVDDTVVAEWTDLGLIIQRIWLSAGNKAVAKIPDFMNSYLNGDGSQVTETNFTEQELADLKSGLQEVFDKGGTIRDPTYSGPIWNAPRLPRTEQFTPSPQQEFDFDMQPGDTVHTVRTYGTTLELLLGTTIVVKDSSGNTKSVHDDYDFVYGNEADRSDGSSAGEPITNTQDGAMYRSGWNNGPGLNHSQVQNQVGNGAIEKSTVQDGYGSAAARIGRSYIVSGHANGLGTPFPIKVRF